MTAAEHKPGRDPQHPQDSGSEESKEEIRGDQGTSSGDPHDDTDPQSG
ncbi:hypothetical protein VA596_15780 [Amycolatopsis sp., V23-08]|uniref:Uncharacterized protein n=1 Tax=Amycolatopsis heterodermiae TaxID=3110235 RepID=A0ABU5R468_9PSEU|nr:hypothetical protein [Amycolatopsis sp., V23-08]MEA5361005.1 hypothetical protein [Amycolatopsis sp., V23-08]